jgi:type IV pilus assembly protein PilM
MLFFRKKQSYLGIDLGSTSIKLVELKSEKGVPTLVTYGYAERAEGDIARGNPEETQRKAVELLKKLHKSAGATSYQGTSALPNFSVFNSVITLPVMSKKELAQAVTWEAKKFVPMPLEDVILDWEIIEEVKSQTNAPAKQSEAASSSGETEGIDIGLGSSENQAVKSTEKLTKEKKLYRILLTAASRVLVKKYVEIFRLADLQLLAIETEAFALARALVGKDQAVTMIIDSSAVTTDIIIIEKGIPVLNRSIDVGGVTLTRAIANLLNIDFKRAEQFKRDVGLSGASKIPGIIEQTLKPVVEEINYSLNLYQTKSGQTIEKVVLSGGSAYLPNLDNYFAKLLNVKVVIGDPWSRISYPVDLKPALQEIAPRFAVAIGLALRQVE